jgi:hypothetical protein
MPHTNVDIFREKGTKNVSITIWEPLNFMKKVGQKNQSRLFLLSFNSKLSHFDKNVNFNLNLNHTNLKKTDVVLIYGEARRHSDDKSTVKSFLKGYFPVHEPL